MVSDIYTAFFGRGQRDREADRQTERRRGRDTEKKLAEQKNRTKQTQNNAIYSREKWGRNIDFYFNGRNRLKRNGSGDFLFPFKNKRQIANISLSNELKIKQTVARIQFISIR